MKKIKYILLGLVIAIVILAIGCTSQTKPADKELGWTIIESPVTGRYYEVATYYMGARSGLMAMSEVTRGEYEAYLLGKNK